jgi:hypothetical protein
MRRVPRLQNVIAAALLCRILLYPLCIPATLSPEHYMDQFTGLCKGLMLEDYKSERFGLVAAVCRLVG